MTYGLLITTAGQAAIATDIGGGTNLVLSHVAFGDASGTPYNPTVSQTALVNERYRSTIAAVAVEANAIVVDAVLPADTDDASGRDSHSFNVAEIGLFSSAGTLIGVARGSNGFKPGPATGQAVIATFRLKLAVSNPSAISVQIDPLAQVPLGRMVRPFWLTIDGVLDAPPVSPAAGATYVIGASPSGAWVGFSGQLAQWIGVWSLSTPPVGHIVTNNAVGLSSPDRFLRNTGSGWVSATASETAFGVARRATTDEVRTGAATNAYVTPEDILGLSGVPLGGLPWPEIYSADARAAISVAASVGNGGSIVVTGGEIVTLGEDMGGGVGRQRRFALPAANFGGLVANSTYFVRLRLNAGVPEVYIQRGALDEAAPGGLVGTPNAATAGGFASTKLDVRLAKVTTGANGSVPVIRRHANKSRLVFYGAKSTGNIGWNTSWASAGDSVVCNNAGDGSVSVNWNFVCDWGRRPVVMVATASVQVSNASLTQYLGSTSNRAPLGAVSSEQTSIAGLVSDYVESQLTYQGNFSWTAWAADAALMLEA